MSMTTMDAYRMKIEAALRELQADLDKLDARIQGAEADARLWFERERRAFEAKEHRLRDRLHELERASSGAMEEVKRGVDEAWADLKASFERARDRF